MAAALAALLLAGSTSLPPATEPAGLAPISEPMPLAPIKSISLVGDLEHALLLRRFQRVDDIGEA